MRENEMEFQTHKLARNLAERNECVQQVRDKIVVSIDFLLLFIRFSPIFYFIFIHLSK